MNATPELRIERAGAVIIAALRGELDLASARDVDEALRARFAADATALIVDLTDVGFLDSSAVQMLFALRNDLSGSRRELALVMPADALPRRSIEIYDANGQLPLYPTREEALGALQPPVKA